MLTYNAILKEIGNVPVDRLEDLYSLIHSLNIHTKKSGNSRKKILSFAGSFKDMSDEDYADFLNETRKTRAGLLEGDIDL